MMRSVGLPGSCGRSWLQDGFAELSLERHVCQAIVLQGLSSLELKFAGTGRSMGTDQSLPKTRNLRDTVQIMMMVHGQA